MRELALHLLDIAENSVRAGATRIRVSVMLDAANDLLTLRVDDNGPGLPVNTEDALNPFFTTKSGKRTGLGLSLFQEAAERAGGRLSLDAGCFGGLGVEATFEHAHIDRTPLGDVATTMMSLLLSNPETCIEFHAWGPGGAYSISSTSCFGRPDTDNLFAAARRFVDNIREALRNAGIGEA